MNQEFRKGFEKTAVDWGGMASKAYGWAGKQLTHPEGLLAKAKALSPAKKMTAAAAGGAVAGAVGTKLLTSKPQQPTY